MKIKPYYITIVIAVIVVAMLGVAVINRNTKVLSPASGEAEQSTSTTPEATITTPLTPGKTPPISGTKTQSSKISILSPISSDKWVVAQDNPIRWSGEAKISGSIYLVRATDKTVPVGWIISEIGPHQTSYIWNTRDVFLSRYNPAKKDLETGDYIIKIKFDSNAMPEISSAPFSIIYASEVVIPIYDVSIKDFKFSPATLTLKKGDKIRFTNNDSVDHRVLLSGVSPYVISSGQSFIFDTSFFRSSASYDFYSDSYPTLNLRVTVQ